MGMHTYHKIKDMLCDELDRVANKGELSAGSLDIIDKLTHSIKSIDTIVAMADYEDDHSERGMSYGRGANYEGVTSYARRRYSRDDSKEHMIGKLEEMARHATDERMRSTIDKCINELERD